MKIKILLLCILCSISCIKANCESLFFMGASQTYYTEPKSLYGSVRARTVGDIVTILMEESVTMEDNLSYNSSRESNTVDNFSKFFNKLLPWGILNNEINNFGGSNTVSSESNNSRGLNFKDNVAVQVVQLMPNGNLVVQGKKSIVNANERVDLLISGVVDPRWIDNTGKVSSKNVANLQFALSGKGTASRINNEGIINRVIRYLF